jgi:putative two-component system response regulator
MSPSEPWSTARTEPAPQPSPGRKPSETAASEDNQEAEHERSGILVVDDDDTIRHLIGRFCQRLGYRCRVAPDGETALEILQPDIDLVLLDFTMPGINGLEVLEHLRSTEPYTDVPVIMITGNVGRSLRISALEAGANDFLNKPFDLNELKARTASMLKMRRAQVKLERQRKNLEHLVLERTADLEKALQEADRAHDVLEESYLDTLRRLSVAAEYKDELTANHVARVGSYVELIGRKLGMPRAELDILCEGSRLHDLGKIGVPDAILLKPSRFTPEDRRVMERHCEIGARILSGSRSNILEAARVIAMTHHEWWDGTGYPAGLKGDKIPLYGRICAVADVFDALTSRRPYKQALSNEEAFRILAEGRGRQFEPRLLDFFLESEAEIEAIQQRYSAAVEHASPLQEYYLEHPPAE